MLRVEINIPEENDDLPLNASLSQLRNGAWHTQAATVEEIAALEPIATLFDAATLALAAKVPGLEARKAELEAALATALEAL